MRTLKSELIRKGLLQQGTGEIEQKNTRTSGKPKEQLSDRDWAELMGTNRATYARKKGGAFRQR